jgi:hypothetical protein
LELLPAGVRNLGLAGAGVALFGHPSSMYDNPAGINGARHFQAELSAAPLDNSDWYTALAVVLPVRGVTVGSGYRRVASETDRGTSIVNDEWLATVGHRLRGVNLGASLRYQSRGSAVGSDSRSLTNDVGVTLGFPDIASVGLVFRNVGRWNLPGDRSSPPASTHVGAAINLIDNWPSVRVMTSIEVAWTAGSTRQTRLGIEADARVGRLDLAVRTGRGPNARRPGDSAMSWGLSAGIAGMFLDYAFQQASAIGSQLHLVGLRLTW